MSSSIKHDLVRRMKQVGAFDVRIADPQQGFDKVPPEVRPLTIWPECKSVVVFAMAVAPACNNIYAGAKAPWQGSRGYPPNLIPAYIQSEEFAMERLALLLRTSITHKGMIFLTNQGYAVSFKLPPLKTSAFESGIGVYGRSGLILHPVLGSKMYLGAILTNAPMEPDPKLENYAPCIDCDLCIKKCPAKAFNSEKEYPESFNVESCIKKRTNIETKGYYCHNCFAVCPAGEYNDKDLLHIDHAISISKKHQFNLYYNAEQNTITNTDK